MIKRIGDGSHTSLWYENWVSNNTLLTMTLLRSPPEDSKQWKVSDILEKGNWKMRIPVLQKHWDDILAIQPESETDMWQWTDILIKHAHST